jgi:hypothetical protein
MTYGFKDSGERQSFQTGAVRDQPAGKGRYDLLQVLALRRVAVVLEKGAQKYDARNWEKGIPLSRYVDSALRHLMQYVEGRRDEDHAGHAAWNLLSMIQTEEMIERGLLPAELNDLPNYVPQEPQCPESSLSTPTSSTDSLTKELEAAFAARWSSSPLKPSPKTSESSSTPCSGSPAPPPPAGSASEPSPSASASPAPKSTSGSGSPSKLSETSSPPEWRPEFRVDL